MTTLADWKGNETGWRHVITEMLLGLRAALFRFPVPTLFLLAATIEANLLIADIRLFKPDASDPDLVFALQGGAVAALAGALFAEVRGLSSTARSALALVLGIAATALVAFPLTFLTIEWTLLPALIGLVLVAPFIRHGSSGSFWMFSARAAFAALLGILALLLFAGGISAILASLSVLFGLEVPDDLHAHVWAFTGLFAAPLFAMGQLPDRFDEEPSLAMAGFMYRGMRALGDFVAAPLLIVYAVILHLYALKIAVTGEVPNGQIGWLVLVYGLCIFGALLIINPFFGQARAPTRLFLRLWPFFLPIPLVLLFYALTLRIGEYGVTPDRYLLGLFGVVTAAILLIQISPRLRGDIRVIAGIPVAALIIGSFGPQGALSISISDQARRFLEIAESSPVEGKRHEEALAALSFLDSHRVLERVAPAGTNTSQESGEGYRATARAWGLDPQRPAKGPRGFIVTDSSRPLAFAAQGFDAVIQNLQLAVSAKTAVAVQLPAGPELAFALEADALVVRRGEESERFPITQRDIESMARANRTNRPVEISLEANGRRIMLVPSYLYADIGEHSHLQNLDATVLLRMQDWTRR